ncbi:hypothetical protein HPB50_012598 [Hyalomma asiaticum]|uniref:Uncharacterized protein n=1 Tax=Hyalomma asiaticum TaxID=266040 RepID=A0ACB7S4U8_HYAAI|nr:hypothetical protein HPB50_012598 [Hyalomma asiaticum]
MPKAEKERYLQKFREEWLKDPDLCTWLICKRKPDGAKYAQCKYCNCALAPKYSDLKAHRTSKKHQSATAVLCPTQTQICFEKKIDDNSASAAEGRAALFIAEHRSIVTADHLTEFVRKSFSDSAAGKDYRMKRTKRAAIIEDVLYPHFKEDIKADIGSSKYSIIVDESTDIAVTMYLAVSIIYHSAQRSDIVTTFLSLCVLNACNADGIVKTIKCTLREHDLKLDNIVVDVYTTKVEDYLDPKPYLGYSFEKHVDDMKKTGLAADEEENLRKRCTKFILVYTHRANTSKAAG